ncbi:MAG TPA: histidinol-phosphatase [Phycisphaerae bacterium]|nr:histidinol-phosphatase [Phycisphaerae bacterium]HOJ72580.1 histidinol-phosphatase [Phycisphaerae bacterium]HOM49759.1 histidinol-phosphatase [Phycisphaerae bacterium]HOQ86748.1 histidinol-phosphatase [Phycisphaerae bacterium]HPP25128.1 histidinol-phosphatase [Phycisphaerae bacterium]
MGTGVAAGLACGLVLLAVVPNAVAAERWFKGNTHTHTWWSDGDCPPEVAVKWYKDHGYQFLVISDHNVMLQGEKWVAPKDRWAKGAEIYEQQFGDTLVKRQKGDQVEYRLKTLDELRAMFEQPGSFLLVPGEEISDSAAKKPVHLNGINLAELIPPQRGETVAECTQRNIDAVLAQRKATGRPMFPTVNHPYFGWAMTAEDIAPLRGAQFFEVHNGHPSVHNYGDATRVPVDRMWDVVLSRRLGQLNLPVMYGVASDDAHNYAKIPGGGANPGRGWIMVRAEKLTPESLVEAMEKGDFYPTTGVILKDIRFENNTLTVEIDAKPGVSYKTQFIGTPRNYDRTVTTRPAADHVVYEYSDTIGQVLAEKEGTKVSYTLNGSELYVRAKIISDAKHPNPFAEGDVEVAWTQPFQPVK